MRDRLGLVAQLDKMDTLHMMDSRRFLFGREEGT
jgi:hypothetical protein